MQVHGTGSEDPRSAAPAGAGGDTKHQRLERYICICICIHIGGIYLLTRGIFFGCFKNHLYNYDVPKFLPYHKKFNPCSKYFVGKGQETFWTDSMSSTIAREGLWSDVIRLAIVSPSLQIVRVQPVVPGSSSTIDNRVGREGGGREEAEATCFQK